MSAAGGCCAEAADLTAAAGTAGVAGFLDGTFTLDKSRSDDIEPFLRDIVGLSWAIRKLAGLSTPEMVISMTETEFHVKTGPAHAQDLTFVGDSTWQTPNGPQTVVVRTIDEGKSVRIQSPLPRGGEGHIISVYRLQENGDCVVTMHCLRTSESPVQFCIRRHFTRNA